MEIISSRSNPKIKQIRALRQRKARHESGLFIAEGIRPIGEAVDAHAQIAFIVYTPDRLHSDYAIGLIHQQNANGVPCYAVTEEVFTSLAEKENPQGILAVIHQPHTTLADLKPANFPWGVALIDPQDPGNVGSILRTVDAVGASGVLLLSSGPGDEGIVDPYHPSSVRASMGSLFWHPIVATSFPEFLIWAVQHHYHIYGTSAHGPLDYKSVEHYQRPCILLMGSERMGLSVEQSQTCELVIRLPMQGRATSLNLAVATGVLLYEMLHSLS